MTEIQHNKEIRKTDSVNPIVAGIAGVIAVSAAVAATLLISNKKNQKKAKDIWVDTKDKVTDYLVSVKSQPIIETNVKKLKEVVNNTKQKIVEI
jgi:hypothetical protein